MAGEFPEGQVELMLARTCGENLPPAVLRGHVDPLNLIFPGGELTGLTAHLYQDPPTARVTNLLAQRAVLEIVQRLPNGKILRILELGGSTSRYDQLHGILRSFNTLRRHACSTSKPHAFTCIHPMHPWPEAAGGSFDRECAGHRPSSR